MEKSKKMSIIGKLLILAATIIWGSSFFILKDAITVWPAYFVIGIRFTVGGAIIALVFIKQTVKINKKVFLHGLLLGLILFVAYYLQTEGLKRTTPAKNAFLTCWYCILVPFFVWFMFKKKPTVYNIIAAVMCLVGIGFVSLNQKFTIEIGDLLTLASGVVFAFQIIFIDRFTAENEDARQLLAIELLSAAVFSWIVCLSTEFGSIPRGGAANWHQIISIAYLCVFATSAAQLFQMIGQKYVSPSASAILLSLEAVFGALFSVIFYKEHLTVRLIIGFSIIFLALVVSETKLEFITVPIKKAIQKKKTKE